MTLPLGLGVVGAGRFASFVLDAVSDLHQVHLHGVTDRDHAAAVALAQRHRAAAYDDIGRLLADQGVDVVVVATPPVTHAPMAVAALEAGRHVFCEKPLATTAGDLARVVEASRRSPGVLVVDHVLRHNPLLAAIGRLQDRLLGPPQRFLFENDASDEDLPGDHWFWDERVSGGIWVEHGVHFLDAAAMLLDHPVTELQATSARRGDGTVDVVTASVLHGPATLATHTHSFTHAHRCERQLLRLDHGSAETRVEGWIPVLARTDLWTDDAGVAALEGATAPDLFALEHVRPAAAPATLDAVVDRDARPARARGRGRVLDLPHHATVEFSLGGHPAKSVVYAESVRAAMADLAHCARTGARPRSGLVEGATAVTTALAAAEATRTRSTVNLSGVTA